VPFRISTISEGKEISTDDEIYGYVEEGTRAHDITPKRAKRLRFATGGSPKTAPNVIGSTGGRRGSAVVFARRVRHPGSKARNFSKTIADKHQKQLEVRLGRAIGDVLERGGD
jgi:hypothetical protein